jgi:hypothetical protein
MMTYSLLGFKLRFFVGSTSPLRHEIRLVHLFYFRFGDLPALADVEFKGGSARNFAWLRRSVPPKTNPGRGIRCFVCWSVWIAAVVTLYLLWLGHNHERNVASLLARRKRRRRLNPRNMQARVAIPRGSFAAGGSQCLLCDDNFIESRLPLARPACRQSFAFGKRGRIDDALSQLSEPAYLPRPLRREFVAAFQPLHARRFFLAAYVIACARPSSRPWQ